MPNYTYHPQHTVLPPHTSNKLWLCDNWEVVIDGVNVLVKSKRGRNFTGTIVKGSIQWSNKSRFIDIPMYVRKMVYRMVGGN